MRLGRLGRLSILLGVVCLLACASGSGSGRRVIYEVGDKGKVTGDGLHLVKAFRTDALFVRPGARLGDYTRFVIAPVDLFYKEPDAGERVNQFQPLERVWFEDMVRRELALAFGRSRGLTIAEAPGPGILWVRAQFTEMALGNLRRPPVGQVTVLASSEFMLYLDLSDSITNESLLRQVDYQRVEPSSLGDPGPQPAVRPAASRISLVDEQAALRRAIGNRARTFQESFDELREIDELPQAHHGRY